MTRLIFVLPLAVLGFFQPSVRAETSLRMEAKDAGVVYRHGAGPGGCDALGARDLWIYRAGDTYYMNYDGAGPVGWLACLATSADLTHWSPQGPVLALGDANAPDSASASYGTTYFDGRLWHMFYLGTRHVTPPPGRVPSTPYVTLYASATSPAGPWTKNPAIIPFQPTRGTYYSATASPGQIEKKGDEYLMFFSASSRVGILERTISIARTRKLDGPWTVDPQPILPLTEQIENSSLYFEPANGTWFLFTNHIDPSNKFTASVVVYWSKDLEHWNPRDKAIVVDGANCTWSHRCIGLPGVMPVGGRLAVFYDGPGGNSTSHMGRDIGLAWLPLPLVPPVAK